MINRDLKKVTEVEMTEYKLCLISIVFGFDYLNLGVLVAFHLSTFSLYV